MDADLAARLPKAEGKARLVLIQLAGRRHIEATNPLLMKASQDPDVQVRCAALTALGAMIAPSDLPILVARATDRAKPLEAKTAGDALRAACARMTDRDACADQMLAMLHAAPAAAKGILLDALVSVGGPKALGAVSAAAKEADPQVRDAAYRAGPVAERRCGTAPAGTGEDPGDGKLQTRALRGYIRVARQFNIPDRQRLAMYGNILRAGRA